MWLLHTTTLKLHEFHGKSPPYAILSHVWGEYEVLFHEVEGSDCKRRLGYQKIQGCCDQAKADTLQYAWVDTCCIDMRSSAELSEAINSMFRWYSEAHICYVYLADVKLENGESWDLEARSFKRSRWWSRGWTLQEILAPFHVTFFDDTWQEIGTKFSMQQEVAQVTRIPQEVLNNPRSIQSASIHQRMSWASSRVTTRIEDIAYCLMGIFDVNMPLLYGESLKAFQRLQTHILAQSNDHSILAWGTRYVNEREAIWDQVPTSILAASPADFLGFSWDDQELECIDEHNQSVEFRMQVTNEGLSMSLPILRRNDYRYAALNWQLRGRPIGFFVALDPEQNKYTRLGSSLIFIDHLKQSKVPSAICFKLGPSCTPSKSINLSEASLIRLTTAGAAILPAHYSIVSSANFGLHNLEVTCCENLDSNTGTIIRLGTSETDAAIIIFANSLGDTCSLLFGRRDRRIWTALFSGPVSLGFWERLRPYCAIILDLLSFATWWNPLFNDRPVYILPKRRCRFRMTVREEPPSSNDAYSSTFVIDIVQEFGHFTHTQGDLAEALWQDDLLEDGCIYYRSNKGRR